MSDTDRNGQRVETGGGSVAAGGLTEPSVEVVPLGSWVAATRTRGLRPLPFALLVLACLAPWVQGCERRVAGSPPVAAPGSPESPTASQARAEVAVRYRCPMHPDVVREAPGDCPICGMALVRIASEGLAATRAEAGPLPAIEVPAAVVQRLGVRSAVAVRGDLRRELETVGYVAFDERRLREVRVRAEGWVEGLAVRAVGETVQAGQPLFTVYSPTLAAAQQEYRDAQAIGHPDLVDAARDRLRALGVGSGSAGGRTTYTAPVAGIVTELGVREGGQVEPGMPALTLVESDRLWIYADLPESLAGQAGIGTQATLRFAFLPGQQFTGTVDHVLPEIDPQTRNVRLRITLAPPAGLRPNMLAQVSLAGPVQANVVHVPRSAVIRDGREERVVLALGAGRFAPRTVVTGLESGERITVLEGLAGGEQVVVAGQFLIDSEASLRAALGRLDSAAPDPHAAH